MTAPPPDSDAPVRPRRRRARSAPTVTESGSLGAQTDWSMIRAAVDPDDTSAAQAREGIAARYWPAIYAYARRFGLDPEASADLTQGFICDVLIGRPLLDNADPGRGRFRALLRTALRRYIAETHRHRTRLRRHPRDGRVVSLDADTMRASEAPARSPDAAFDREWAAALIRRVLEEIRATCHADAMEAHWTLFEERVARPMLTGSKPLGYPELVGRTGVEDAGQAANMVVTVKRRVARALRDAVSSTVPDPTDVDDELTILLRALESGR